MSEQFQSLVKEAHDAGVAAMNHCRPDPMVVRDGRTGEEWFIADGMCGFAWIEFAGNTAFGRWAKKTGLARKHYPRGLSIWVSLGGQSYDLKSAYARAFSAVLQKAGVNAHAGSRLD